MHMISLICLLIIGIFNICESKEYCKIAKKYCDDYCCIDNSMYYGCCSSCSNSLYTTYCSTVTFTYYTWIPGVVVGVISVIVGIIILILYFRGCICKKRVRQSESNVCATNTQNIQINTIYARNRSQNRHPHPRAPPVNNTVNNNNQSGSLPYPVQPTPDNYVPPPYHPSQYHTPPFHPPPYHP